MREEIDWSLCTWEGNRRLQHREFRRLTFREKLEALEELGRLVAALRPPGEDKERGEGESDG